MSLLDSILNVAVLLLWLNWRSRRLDPMVNSIPSTLAGTLKSTQPSGIKRWQFLIGFCLLILLRVLVSREIGSPVDWTPRLSLGFVALPFRSDNLSTATLYSILSTLRLVIIFYFWLLVLVMVNRGNPEPDPIQKLLRFHAGRMGRWPGWAQVLAPMVLTAGIWMAIQPLLVRCDVATRAHSMAHLLAQGLLVGFSLVFSLKYLIPSILFLHVVSSYVYLGSNALWDFISATSRNLLRPFRRLPLRVAKVDFAPLLAVLVILAVLNWLPGLVTEQLARRNLTLWPR